MGGTTIPAALCQLDPDKTKLFAAPADPAPQTFELGLVLGGTVSAGAYTAGALDLLVQALDAFHAWNASNPPHKVILRLAAGTSGGAVCAAILGVSLNRQFAHATGNAQQADPAGNMLWDLWINRLTFSPMLDTADLDNEIQDPPDTPGGPASIQHVRALLNGAPIDGAVAAVVAYANQPGQISRSWAASPFRLATTVCNLRGVPFRISHAPALGTFTGTDYVEHDDYAWFALPNVVGDGDGTIEDRGPNEFWLSSAPKDGVSFSYQTLGNYARASAAMPVGLPSRPLSRPPEHYLYRPYARVDDTGAVKIAWPMPDWAELDDVMAGQPYSFTGVDGGTLNNDPVKIAHDALTGVGAHNPQQADQANRALLLIDPLADAPTSVAPVGQSIVAAVKALLGTFIDGARYLTADLDLFQDEDVFSRFQLVPNRTGLDGNPFPDDPAPRDGKGGPPVGEAALAGTDLSALGGWCARPFRVHDFLLGRLNMATYLRREMILRGDNDLFNNWTFETIATYATRKNGDKFVGLTAQTPKEDYYLPVIPLPDDNFGVAPPAWPVDALTRDELARLQQQIDVRAKAILAKLQADDLPGFAGWLLDLVAGGGLSSTIAGDVISAFTQSLTSRNLLSPVAQDPVAAAQANGGLSVAG